jgi:hypothetical protein
MPYNTPFEVAGPTIRVDVTGTTATGDLGVDAPQLAIWNSDDVDAICIRFFSSAALATANAAVLPTVGNPQAGHFVPPRVHRVITPRGRYFSVIGTGAAVVYMTPGEGA